MTRFLSLLAIPCLAQGIFAQGPAAAKGDTSLHIVRLQEAITLAQRTALAAVQARGQITTSASGVRAAYGAFLPSLSATLGQSQQSGTSPGTTGQLQQYSAPPWRYSTGLSASLLLFDGGKRFTDLRARKADVLSAETNQTAQSFNIALQVKTQYVNILAARESESAARSQLEQAEQQLKAAAARVEAGAATVSDSLRTVIQVGNAQLALITAQNNLKVASAALTRLVGTPFLVTADPSDTLDRPIAAIDSTALAQFAARGPAVQQAEAQLNSAHAAERSALTSYLPTVSVTYNYAGAGNNEQYGFSQFGSLQYLKTLGFNLRFPLFDNLAREDNVTRARVAEDNAQATLRDAQLGAQQNIITQLAALNAADARVRIQLVTVASAEEDLRVQQQRYALGASTLLDLLTSQSTLNTARAGLIQARQDYRIARAQIEAIIGRDLQ